MPIWMIATQWLSRGVLVALLILSVWSISIILDRRKVLGALRRGQSAREIQKSLEDALAAARQSGTLAPVRAWSQSPDHRRDLVAGAIAAALAAEQSDADALDRSVRAYLITRKTELEHGLTVLATLGANAPFVGLFGTVLGIIQAFGSLSQSSSASTEVMSGISEALIATAVGLFVAIPAVVAFNVFGRWLKEALSECEAAKEAFIAQATHFHKR
jgi:biopolymer transport protein ExbB/TolQ